MVHIARSSRLVACLLLTPAVLVLLWSGTIAAQTASEYSVKAAFLYNAPKFVDWPPEDVATPVFTIGILGDDPFGADLDQLRNKTIKGKRIVIRRFTSIDNATDCQMVFVSASEQRRLVAVLSRLRGLPVLTVSDLGGFAVAGGILEISMDRNRLTFVVNNRQAKRQGLRISAQMLKLAREIVE